MDDYEWNLQILQGHSDKSFVKRILNPDNAPFIPWGDGNRATHRMSWGEADGRYFAYPTVLLQKDGTLKDYGDDAFDQVMRTGNYIEFSTPEGADHFTKTYKSAWGGKRNNEPR